MKSDQFIRDEIEHWLDTAVIGLNLCPFAKQPREKGQVRFVTCKSETIESLLEVIADECLALTRDSEIETTLIATPYMLAKFDDYLDALEAANILLKQLGFEGSLQIASFHPHYQFDDTETDDTENLTNRSPYPVFHLIREATLEKAIKRYGDTSKIPNDNISTLNKLSKEQLADIFGARAGSSGNAPNTME